MHMNFLRKKHLRAGALTRAIVKVFHSFGKEYMQSKIGMRRAKAILWRVANQKGFGKMFGWRSVFTNSFPTLE